METNVQLRCLKRDHSLLESLLGESAEVFNALVKKETKKDISVKLLIDTNNFLDERLGNRSFTLIYFIRTFYHITVNLIIFLFFLALVVLFSPA